MAQLVQSFIGDTAIRLQNEEFVRQMSFGTDWTHLRLGLLLSIPQGVGTIFSPTFYVGLCQGTTDAYKSATTTEWVGWRFGQGASNWTFNAGPPAYYSSSNVRSRVYKIGSTVTATAIISVTDYMPIGVRAFYGFDILKTATGYSLSSTVPTAPSIPTVDINEINFLMNAHADPSGVGFAALNFASNFLLDSVSLYWDFAPLGIEISSMVVVRVV